MSYAEELEFSLESAIQYNEDNFDRISRGIWWKYPEYDAKNYFPKELLDEYPCLMHDPVGGSDMEKAKFAEEVHKLQQDKFKSSNEWDGKLGRNTWMLILHHYDMIQDQDNYIVHKGRRYRLPNRDEETATPTVLSLIAFDAPDGYDLHPAGNFSRRNEDGYIQAVILHWGGSSVNHLYNYMKTTDREVSTHFGVWKNEIYQFLDTHHKAWHAGWCNDTSVGIDICQSPLVSYESYYKNKAAHKENDIHVVDNPTNRGRDKVLSLDTQTATTVRHLVKALCDIFSIEPVTPELDGEPYHGVVPFESGIYGHHHVSRLKWDIAPWWHQIFPL